METENSFEPYNKIKRFHKITYVGYEFTVNGKNIEFEERVLPQRLDVKDGDMFVVKLTESGQVILERAEFE